MKIKSDYFIYIIVFLLVLMVIFAYIFNDSFDLCIGTDGVCTNIKIPNFGGLFIVIFSTIISICMFFWRHFIIKEKNDEIRRKNNTIKNKKENIKEKENFAETLNTYIEKHSNNLDISFISGELVKINKNIIIIDLEKSKNIIKDKISGIKEEDLETF